MPPKVGFGAFCLRIGQAVWRRLPTWLRNTRMMRWYGTILHRSVRTSAHRRQFFGTFFLRNRPELEQIRRLVVARPRDSELRLAVMGCSIGAEVYSVSWAIRSARPDIRLSTAAVDISAEMLSIAQRAVYSSASSGLVGESIFERLTETESREIFDWRDGTATIKPPLTAGISWHLRDASDPNLLESLGHQDIVLASNFLCHMTPDAAERCLRNIARLVRPGGHILVLGIDLDVREKVARDLGWTPLHELIREIHEGDPVLRRDWPLKWWGLEPFDERRPDWRLRYAAAFQVT